MYKVLIYSLDFFSANGLSHAIFWEKEGFSVCGNATNERDFKRMMASEKPRVLILDSETLGPEVCKMAKEIRQNYKALEVLSFGTEKPQCPAMGDHIYKSDTDEETLRSKLAILHDKLMSSQPSEEHYSEEDAGAVEQMAREQYLKNLLFGIISPVTMKIPLPHSLMALILVPIEGDSVKFPFYKELLERGEIIYTINSAINELSFLCNFRDGKRIHNLANRLQSLVEGFYNRRPNMYISKTFSQMEDLHTAYLQCRDVMEMQEILPGGQLVFNLESAPKEEEKFMLSREIIEDFQRALDDRDEVKLKLAIASLINSLHGSTHLRMNETRYFLSQIFYSIEVFNRNCGLDPDLFWDDGGDAVSQLESLFNKEEIISYLGKAEEKLIALMKGGDDRNLYIDKMKAYVREHFRRDISLSRLADQIGLTTSYMSTLFRKHTGQKFSDFIINCRLGEAKNLLCKTDLPIQEISEQVGYENEHYFSKLFKQRTGSTPTQYRKSHTEIQ